MNDSISYGVTMFGLTSLQMPTLISIAPKDSILSSLQVLGFPFNMSKEFLKEHVAFSPANVLAGRYYTLFTSVYYHAGYDYMIRNMGILALIGKVVHTEVGRQHFMYIFTGGGLAGNLAMWLHLLVHRSCLKNGILDLHNLQAFANSDIVRKFKDQCLAVSFDILNSWLSCNGASAAIYAILSFGACCAAERVARILREPQDDQSEIKFVANMMHIIFTFRLVYADVVEIVASFETEYGFFDQLISTQIVIGHAGHVGGMLFGVGYYFMYKRR